MNQPQRRDDPNFHAPTVTIRAIEITRHRFEFHRS
jgi:hypothetical protein